MSYLELISPPLVKDWAALYQSTPPEFKKDVLIMMSDEIDRLNSEAKYDIEMYCRRVLTDQKLQKEVERRIAYRNANNSKKEGSKSKLDVFPKCPECKEDFTLSEGCYFCEKCNYP